MRGQKYQSECQYSSLFYLFTPHAHRILDYNDRQYIIYKTDYTIHKPSYEPYYLPFNSVHPKKMKKNIPFAILLRAIKYCSTFEAYLNEREKL